MSAGIEVPEIPALPAPAFPNPTLPKFPATDPVHVGFVEVVVLERVGIVGIDELGPTVLTMGNRFGKGTDGVELTPRLLISNDPNGIPVRAVPPGAVGAVDVGVDDAATLLEPEPHIPDIPDVSSIPGDPEFIGSSVVTGAADGSDIAPVPEFVAVAGIVVPIPVPPPSKLALEPNISAGEVATVAHAALLVVVGIVIVPVVPVGSGLTPGELISVAPNGTPAGEIAPPVATPSGEVAPTMGVGLTDASDCPPTCAMAKLHTKSDGTITAMNETLTRILHSGAARNVDRSLGLFN